MVAHFRGLGYQIVSISRTGPGDVRWNARTPGPWVQELEGADLLVNLAGRSVDCRYTAANRRAILASRTESTRVLGAAVAACARPPRVWLNASTATICPDTQGAAPANTEVSATPGTSFSEEVGLAWEAAFAASPAPATKVALRTAIVLGRDGGAFPVMARLARLGLCSPQGTGQQWISWLHIQDFCRAVAFLAQADSLSGPVNLCAPHPLRNGEFNALLARELRPLLRLPQPRWLLEIGAFALRTETELILKSRKVYPEQLLAAGFQFEYERCEAAVGELLRKTQIQPIYDHNEPKRLA
ncbi:MULTISPECIES: TIGR01777 family oxidoreductase [Hymenobacter]|uniref:TIGR01777 family oxidoreductase n=1 Tax=Hymenobacter TaxID=89966 RepID=UPI001F2AB571|nr:MULTISPECIES: TIGR01777 family oxidoreductase [unclassified Hymenobacter]